MVSDISGGCCVEEVLSVWMDAAVGSMSMEDGEGGFVPCMDILCSALISGRFRTLMLFTSYKESTGYICIQHAKGPPHSCACNKKATTGRYHFH